MNCDDPIIDGLVSGEASIHPLSSGAKGLPVEYLQELLRGHGYVFLPDPRSPAHGVFGLSTRHAVTDYRWKHGLSAGESADSVLLTDIMRRIAPNAVLGPAYVPLVLNVPFTAITRFIWLTSLFETTARFSKLNLNTDQCGVSFGVLQWAQKPGRLHELLEAFCMQQPAEWDRIMGKTGILDHTAQTSGGVDSRGHSIDPQFELTQEPWKSKLQALGRSPAMQHVQIDLASDIYLAELEHLQSYAHEIRSERGYAFMLDLANQFGGERVEEKYKAVALPGKSEAGILKRLEDTFTYIARPPFRPPVRARREFFRTTSLVSDNELQNR